ncbi:MAG TPA: cytochrome C oxidase subunit IV family protein [Thermoanaerobaculia bacterium]|nr:cytochrome C oxidase subunit IV family protein [Thermoanaerobaculia bacterium]
MTDTAIHPQQGTPDQHAGGAPREPLGEHEHPTHEEQHHGHDNSPEAIRKEIRRYMVVFGALAVLTIVTVAISQLHLPTWQAVALALVVATVKGSLVAAFFMHLVSERKLIYAVLALTVFFFGVLMWGPWHHRDNAEKVWPGYDINASKPATARTTSPPSGSGH